MKVIKRFILTVIFCVLTVVGLLLLAATAATRIPSLGLFGEAHRTTGTVVGINHWMESGESFTSPQVEFIADSGQKVSVDMICPPLDCYAENEVGAQVGLIYPSNFPELAIADSLMGRLGTPLFMIIIGLVLLGIGSVGLAISIREWRDGFKRLFKITTK